MAGNGVPISEARFCKDCNWYRSVQFNAPQCEASREWDLVTGESYLKNCQDMRRGHADCGALGILFQARGDQPDSDPPIPNSATTGA